VESLVDALHDPIHPASGSLIRSQPVKGAGGVDKTDIVWRLRANWSYLGREAADEIERLRLAPDEREAINAMACYFDTKGNIQMQAWGSLLRVILLRNDATSTR
jgi:hypothetical protein